MLLNKKLILLLACVSLLLCVMTLQETYAKYVSQMQETTTISVARWRILVNNVDIRSNTTTTNLITPVFLGTANIASGVIAPTATGYFDIIIDSSDTDLSFAYTISIENDVDSLVQDIIITSCTLNGTQVTVTNGVVTGTISYNALNQVNTLRVFIEWNDGTGQTMTNADDTSVTMEEDPSAVISVSAHFIQTVS